jgi:hypothetical protein
MALSQSELPILYQLRAPNMKSPGKPGKARLPIRASVRLPMTGKDRLLANFADIEMDVEKFWGT